MSATPIRGVSSLRLSHFVTSEFTTFMHNPTLFQSLPEPVQLYKDTENSLIRYLHRRFFPECIFRDDAVLQSLSAAFPGESDADDTLPGTIGCVSGGN